MPYKSMVETLQEFAIFRIPNPIQIILAFKFLHFFRRKSKYIDK